MARITQTLLSFLSTAIFFATFIIAGDILIAATVAIFTALVQFVVRQSAYRRQAVLIWASLAIVVALTGLSLKGDEAAAASRPTMKATHAIAPCACHAPARAIQAALPVRPTL